MPSIDLLQLTVARIWLRLRGQQWKNEERSSRAKLCYQRSILKSSILFYSRLLYTDVKNGQRNKLIGKRKLIHLKYGVRGDPEPPER